MKTVTNITLGGMIFAIEDDAFVKLREYLASIEAVCQQADDFKEISTDIESAIAEKFSQLHKNDKTAVSMADVEMIIAEMGSAADFAEENSANFSATESTHTEPSANTERRRLYRDSEDVVIAGVASGIAAYFDIDPVIVRILFIISIFFSGVGILAYLILWLAVPVAETTAQKYAMRGEKVTLSHITKRVKKNLDEIDTSVLQSQKVWTPLRDALKRTFELFGALIRFIAKASRYIVGVGLIGLGVFGLAGLTSAVVIGFFSEKSFMPPDGHFAFDMFMGDPIGLVAVGTTFIALAIPLLFAAIIGAGLCAKRNLLNMSKTILLGSVWIIAGTVAATTMTLQIEKVVNELHDVCEENVCGERGEIRAETVEAFTFVLQHEVTEEIGMPIEGYEPAMFMQVFPGLVVTDFENVEASIGHYTVEGGTVVHKLDDSESVHSAAQAITYQGMNMLLRNISDRLDIDLDEPLALTLIMHELTRAPQTDDLPAQINN